MADDRHYVPGSFYRIDDRTGFKIRAEKSRKQWNNIIVSPNVWEIRQPQDFVRGVRDLQTVPDARPRQPNLFVGPGSAQFEVYGDRVLGKTFLVNNQNSGAFNIGINAESEYTNPTGLAQFVCYNGTIPTVLASNFPSSIS